MKLWLWIMNEFMIICCWCCFGTCCWWIDTMGITICELLRRIVVVDEKLWKLVNCWILMKWCFNLKFYVCSCIWPVNIIWNEFWVGKDQNWDFGEKGFETRNFLTELMSIRLSERQASSKRTSLVDSGHSSLERAPSELQASERRMLLVASRLSEQPFD